MSVEIRILGIDLASRSWQDNGSAILTSSAGSSPSWMSIKCGCIVWPAEDISARAMATTIERTVAEHGLSAVSLDGPQGWREPNAEIRKGVGRVCEYEARCQGKTGEYGKTYPQTQHSWIQFCINVFAELVAKGRATIANDPKQCAIELLKDGKYWLLECFPSSTWEESCLRKLPAKSRIGNDDDLIAAYARSLQQRYRLPGLNPWNGTHDDLQAIVAALPAAGLLGGPCSAVPNGKSGWHTEEVGEVPGHWVEGVIWDATLPEDELAKLVGLPEPPASGRSKRQKTDADAENPLLIDDRDDDGKRLLDRGVELFRALAEMANDGKAIGIGYAQLVCCVHGVDDFRRVANRQYSQSDTTHVLQFAHQITDESGGPIEVTRAGVTIKAGMDAFVWRKDPPHVRPERAFEDADYSKEEWKAIFLDGSRRLLGTDECSSIVNRNDVDDGKGR